MSASPHSRKKRVAVFFGGRTPEHDVSVVTALQILQAIDATRYDSFPVYITPDGRWLTGDVLRKRENFLLSADALKQTREVVLDVAPGASASLLPKKTGLFAGGAAPIPFDVALPSFHGINGEDGTIQGLFDLAGVAYAGMRALACAVLMDKAATKKILRALDIPCLPYAELRRPDSGYLIPRAAIAETIRAANIGFPCIIKPSHLGSSIGVAKAANEDEIVACLPTVFACDDTAIIEPFVPNLVEYNVATARIDGAVRISAIERPKTSAELLDFKEKYLAGGGKSGAKSGTKTPGQASEGMLSLTREINPQLPPQAEDNIRRWVTTLYNALDGTGAPRTDFIGNRETGEIWLNEVNPWPGSLGYFLWESAERPLLFSELLTHLVEEALDRRTRRALPPDPVPEGARLLHRPR